MSRLPSRDECIKMLLDAGCEENVVQHCLVVASLAVTIAELADADERVVEVGALLHDIGRGQTHGIKHGVAGAHIGKQRGLPDIILRIIENHLGAGIPKEQAIRLGLPPRDYIPETLEEKIVAHADNLIERNQKQSLEEAATNEIKKGNKDVAKRMRELHNELSRQCGINLDEINLKHK